MDHCGHCAGSIKLTIPFKIVSSKITKKIKGQMAYLGNFKTFGIAILILAAGLVLANSASAADVRAQIDEINVKWVKAFKDKDFALIEALYMPDGILLPPNTSPIEDHRAIASVWKSWSEIPNVEIAFGADRVVAASSGDMAYDYGWYTFAFDTDRGRSEDKGKYVVVWKKVNDAWKVAAHIFSSNLPAPVIKANTAESCVADNKTGVTANGECLVIKTYGESAQRTSLVVFIHGDGYRPDPADYGPSDYMYWLARNYGTKGVVAVGLIRPGYFDSKGNHSTGNSHRAWDNYQSDVIETVAAAVKALKHHYKAENVILAGHSGGSAISGVIIGMYPELVDAVVLGACPCNVPEWRTLRRGYNNWPLSLSPHDFIGKIDKGTKVFAITGGYDRNTEPVIARDYVASLKRIGIDATYIEVTGAGHNRIEQTSEYKSVISQLLEDRF
jgi:ketosteroid isomerase-like protein/pimeloyl-ACP methyl ester carboxylesterase